MLELERLTAANGSTPMGGLLTEHRFGCYQAIDRTKPGLYTNLESF
jgi:hypothetical protein